MLKLISPYLSRQAIVNKSRLLNLHAQARTLASTMSWMDSWSRPSKHQATPPPLYLLPGGSNTRYCAYCGRVISSRKSHPAGPNNTKSRKSTPTAAATPPKYCSSRCRNSKSSNRRWDREIEAAFVAFLDGENFVPSSRDGQDIAVASTPTSKTKGSKLRTTKGDPRILVQCSTVEEAIFGSRKDPEKVFGRKKDRARRGVPDEAEWRSVDMEDGAESRRRADMVEPLDDLGMLDDSASGEDVDGDVLARLSVRSGTRIRPPQSVSEVNGGVGGEKGRAERVEESEEMEMRRREGEKKAREREMVRCAARRGVAFGFVVGEPEDETVERGERPKRRKCEAVMQGRVIESSFAKGEWGVRWREGE